MPRKPVSDRISDLVPRYKQAPCRAQRGALLGECPPRHFNGPRALNLQNHAAGLSVHHPFGSAFEASDQSAGPHAVCLGLVFRMTGSAKEHSECRRCPGFFPGSPPRCAGAVENPGGVKARRMRLLTRSSHATSLLPSPDWRTDVGNGEIGCRNRSGRPPVPKLALPQVRFWNSGHRRMSRSQQHIAGLSTLPRTTTETTGISLLSPCFLEAFLAGRGSASRGTWDRHPTQPPPKSTSGDRHTKPVRSPRIKCNPQEKKPSCPAPRLCPI